MTAVALSGFTINQPPLYWFLEDVMIWVANKFYISFFFSCLPFRLTHGAKNVNKSIHSAYISQPILHAGLCATHPM